MRIYEAKTATRPGTARISGQTPQPRGEQTEPKAAPGTVRRIIAPIGQKNDHHATEGRKTHSKDPNVWNADSSAQTGPGLAQDADEAKQQAQKQHTTHTEHT